MNEDSDEESDETVEPAECQEVFDGLDEWDEDPKAEASRTYTAGMLGPFVGVKVSSYTDEVPEDGFAEVLDAFETCPEITTTEDGERTTFTISGLSFPNFGEESAAVRMTATGGEMAFGVDFVMIRAGHNLVSLSHATVGGAGGSGETLEKVARVTVENLKRG